MSEEETTPEVEPSTYAIDSEPPSGEEIAGGTNDEGTAQVEEVAAAPEFTPDYSYKAFQKEYEIPEDFRQLIKDEETQRSIKDIFVKSQGFEHLKSRYDATQEEYKGVNDKYTQLQTGVNQLSDNLRAKDYDSFFKNAQISPDEIYKWVLDKVNYNEAPPEEKARADAQRDLENRAYQAEQKTRSLTQAHQDAILQAKRYELDMTLSSPDIKAFSEAFDGRTGGNAGDFREHLLDRAELAWHKTGGKIDMTAEQAAREVMSLYSHISPVTAPTQAPGQTNQVRTGPTAKTIIPKVRSHASASPLSQKPARSIESLRKIYNQKYVTEER